MTKANEKIALSTSRDIPFNKLVLSQSNVRRIKAGVAIEELAEDIARRTLLQSLTVRAVLDGDGNETGMYEIPAGGRRYRALQLLIKQKRLPKTAPIPCIVRAPRFASPELRAANQVELRRLLEVSFADLTVEQCLEMMNARGVPCAPINSYSEALSDPQVLHYDWVKSMSLPEGASIKTFGSPITINGNGFDIYRRPPALGEHTDEVFTQAHVKKTA